ncbi:MAG: FAD-dependent oxidoreductase [Thermodesulfobacteriota bacterium]
MPQIGIFMDALKGTLPSSFRERLLSSLRELPEVSFCVEEEDLTSSVALERISKLLQKKEIERIVILGGSPKIYETSFQKFAYLLPLNLYLITVANILEQALWHQVDEEEAFKKALKEALKALQIASSLMPIETQSLPLKPEVLILGGGITGISIALNLSKTNLRVFLIEKEKTLGGKALELWKFYNREEEVREWLEKKISELQKNPQITLLTQARLKRLRGQVGRFQATIITNDEEEITLNPSAIVVATGYSVAKKRGGLYDHKRIIYLPEMEKILMETTSALLLFDGKRVDSVTYLLDEFNEEIKLDSINALRQSLLLRECFQCQVTILCKDLKVSSEGMERLYRKARGQGVLFVKYEEPPRFSIVNSKIQVEVKDTAILNKKDQWSISILSDLVVLGETILPNPETTELCNLLQLHLGSKGFLMEDNPQLLRIRSNRKGIFVAGGCRFPQEISETLIEADAVAQEVLTLLSKGVYTYDLTVAEVDPKKCALCYTCPRVCPHSAITIEKYAERNVYLTYGFNEKTQWGAAKVDPASCFGCGICVGECPAKAITLRHLPDELIYIQMGLV